MGFVTSFSIGSRGGEGMEVSLLYFDDTLALCDAIKSKWIPFCYSCDAISSPNIDLDKSQFKN